MEINLNVSELNKFLDEEVLTPHGNIDYNDPKYTWDKNLYSNEQVTFAKYIKRIIKIADLAEKQDVVNQKEIQ